ncbi:MAG: tetratricopeptide repeat protein, partial [Sedimentisphaerales bacterium]
MASLILVVLLLCTRMQVQRWRNSLTLFKHAIAVTKNNYTMHYNYANALRRDGRLDQAIRHFEETVRINPKYYKGQNNLALAYYLKGKMAQAIASWHKAIEVKPDFIDAINNLAWIRATHHDSDVRDSDEAVRLAKRTCELTEYNRPDLLDTLAAAYAVAGKFDEAVAIAERAFELAQSTGQSHLAGEIRNHLRFYKVGEPYIEPSPKVPSG